MMYRRKIDYLTKGLSATQEKDLYYGILDMNGHGKFQSDLCRFLKDPIRNQKDLIALSMIPGGILGKEYIDRFITGYHRIFREINDWCKTHRIVPFFPDPTDVKGCLDIREDLIVRRPEEELNLFFGVESYHDYTAPIYTPPETEE